MTTQPKRVLTRSLHFAWIELDFWADGVAFHKAISSAKNLGFRNLFLKLPRKSKGQRQDPDHPDLKIKWFYYLKHSGLLLVPPMNSDSGKFLEKWILNPGVKMDQKEKNGTLTHDNDGTIYADLIVASGHGSADGIIWGNLGKKLPNLAVLDIQKSVRENGQIMDSYGKLKYIIIPACSTQNFENAYYWLPALLRSKPVHGFLGYHAKYQGGYASFLVFKKFAELLKDNPDLAIVKAWQQANSTVARQQRAGLEWSAIILKACVGDNMRKWTSPKGLEDPKNCKEALYFDEDDPPVQDSDGNWTGGKPIEKPERDWLVQFVMANGTIVTIENKSESDVGLFPGDKGELVVKQVGMRFGQFETLPDTVHVVFNLYRDTHKDMDLSKLLIIDPAMTPGLRLAKDQNSYNKQHPAGITDSFYVTLPAGKKEIRIPYTVSPNATTKKHGGYEEIGANAGAYGYFYVECRFILKFDDEEDNTHTEVLKEIGVWLRSR